MAKQSKQEVQIQSAVEPSVVIVPHKREIHVHQLTNSDIDQLAEAGLGRSLNAFLATALFGAFVTVIVWMLTTEFRTETASGAATGAAIAVGVLFVFFALRAVGDYWKAKKLIKELKGEGN